METILRLERENNSRNGNSCYTVVFTDKDGDVHVGKTKTDSSFCYTITNIRFKKPCKIKYHYTPKGKCIIDDVEEV